ncbi:hypothetical protein GUITHDRAFT_122679 [Guillardia theta CCMP2712]|uniref:Calcineurin-like phosphoesterase domain-containing protein n=1 Tax=Guillardia theta (strain CCMP2712) TaxID=905079 RepID=L1I5E7_GUITC|nr:hypothetical protein GUITHDRAFT_122679 [Guillardia theta CCMP2712]EKX31114.1 hypothetical protein GUITHDRAFT_122679 [Guillardia theta CCMP2712]|eukprot:XP_005818094.1 hypothetical protein GUITHDRAFT_122679 [Guillardia theta CCMP2712]
MLVSSMFDGPVDIIGDVHGEIGALLSVLDVLGYNGHGEHAEGRRLVFVGDVVDRGPDSVRCLQVVRGMVESGRAQMVLGNHELNLLRGSRKHGNLWFWGEEEVIRKDKAKISFQTLADEAFREEALSFLRKLPLVLEREDCRVVHACWDDESISKLRSSPGDVMDAYRKFQEEVKHRDSELAARRSEQEGMARDIEIERELNRQNGNPVLVTCSGKEERAAERFFAGGKWRDVDRNRWWNKYEEEKLVVFGHYWRSFPRSLSLPLEIQNFKPSGPDMFPDVPANKLLGPRQSACCIDYSVGIRYEERGMRLHPGALGTKLCALRLPERQLVFEDSSTLPLEAT